MTDETITIPPEIAALAVGALIGIRHSLAIAVDRAVLAGESGQAVTACVLLGTNLHDLLDGPLAAYVPEYLKEQG